MSAVEEVRPAPGELPEAGSARGFDPAPPARRRSAAPFVALARLPGCLVRLGLGLAAALVVTGRVQLAILQRYPEAEWMALAGGLLAGGLALSVALCLAFGLPSPRRALLLMAAVPILLVAAGCLSVAHFPEAGFRTPELRGEWERLHPTLRLSLWIARLGGEVVVTGVARAPWEYGSPGLPESRGPDTLPAPGRGYARGVDLRTPEAGPLVFWARQGLFLGLGLKASPHFGAPGHLRVSLPPR